MKVKDPLNKEERKVMDGLRDKGFAITVFTPQELNNANPEDVQDYMINKGWECIINANAEYDRQMEIDAQDLC